MDIIKFAKLRNDVIIPSKKDEDACYDLYANFEEDYIVFKPHETKLVSTGLISSFDKKYRIVFNERGSNTKSKLKVTAGVIDSGFRGEWFVALYNTTDEDIIIEKFVNDYTIINDTLYVPYSKAVCQFSVEEVPVVKIKEVPIEEIKNNLSERGESMLGQSGK